MRLCVNGRAFFFSFDSAQMIGEIYCFMYHDFGRIFFLSAFFALVIFSRILTESGLTVGINFVMRLKSWSEYRPLLPCLIFMFKISKWYSILDTQLLTIPIYSHITCRSIHNQTLYSNFSFTEWLNFTVPLVFMCSFFFFSPLYDYLQIISK